MRMRHRRRTRKLGRKTPHRLAMFRNMVTSLIEHERIVTTVPRAKELRRLADKMVTLAKDGSLHARRQALSVIRNKGAVAKLFEEIAPKFSDRNGGYTRIVRIGPRRGDAAEMSVVEFAVEQLAAPGASRPKAKRQAEPSAVESVVPQAVPAAADASSESKPDEAAEAGAGAVEEGGEVTAAEEGSAVAETAGDAEESAEGAEGGEEAAAGEGASQGEATAAGSAEESDEAPEEAQPEEGGESAEAPLEAEAQKDKKEEK